MIKAKAKTLVTKMVYLRMQKEFGFSVGYYNVCFPLRNLTQPSMAFLSIFVS